MCDCQEDIHHISPLDNPLRTIKISSISTKPISFAFASKDGLLRLNSNGSIAERNILGLLISISDSDISKLYDFFSNNGFLFPVSSDSYESMDLNSVQELIKHIRATVELMSALGAVRKNYSEILQLCLYLIMSEPVSIRLSNGDTYVTCSHPFREKILNAAYPDTKERLREAADGEFYHVADTIYPPIFNFSTDDYADIMSNTYTAAGSDNWFFMNIVNMYCLGTQEDANTRLLCDFLFHYEYEVGIIRNFEYRKSPEHYANPISENFTDQLKKQLLTIAKIVISEEINSNLSGIHPQYNVETMAPTWKVDSLLSAIYFSIFYMKPELELYRQCANPNCRRYFLVRSTSTRNKYCSPECCNRMSQSMYRKRKREREQA